MALTEGDLLPFHPDFDEQEVFGHYLKLRNQYHRRHNDLDVRHAIRVLHCDPTVEPRLTSQDVKDIISVWMKRGLPVKAHGLFENHPSLHCLVWEACLSQAGSAPQNGKPGKESVDDILARRAQERELKSGR